MTIKQVATGDFYAYWNDLLDGKKPKFHDGHPQGGLYFMKQADGSQARVRIDRDPSEIRNMMIWVNGEARPPREYNRIWLGCGRNAVTHDAYAFHTHHGHWPDGGPKTQTFTGKSKIAGKSAGHIIADDVQTVGLGNDYTERVPDVTITDDVVTADDVAAVNLAHMAKITEKLLPQGYGDNNPPPDEIEQLLPYTTAAIEAWLEKFDAFTHPHHLQEAADQKETLRQLCLKAEKQHKAEKDELTKAGRAIDKRLLHPAQDGRKLIDKIGDAVAAYHDKLRAEAQAKADAERAAQEKEAEAKLAEIAAKPVAEQMAALKEVAATLAPTAPVTFAPAKVTTSTGKAAFTVKTKKFAEIEDQDKLYQAVRTDVLIVEALRKIAQRDLDDGVTRPGVKVVEKSVA